MPETKLTFVSRYDKKTVVSTVNTTGDSVELSKAKNNQLSKRAKLIQGDYFQYAFDHLGERYSVSVWGKK